jgi:hypothetical protein
VGITGCQLLCPEAERICASISGSQSSRSVLLAAPCAPARRSQLPTGRREVLIYSSNGSVTHITYAHHTDVRREHSNQTGMLTFWR